MKAPSLFDQPITWGDYVEYRAASWVLGLIVSIVVSLIVAWHQVSRCPSCRRDARQWSWRAVGVYKNRHFWCPYCDPAPGESDAET